MSFSNYQRQIRSAVRGLWRGVISFEDFRDALTATINRGMNQAWKEGAGECGISLDELSEPEQEALQAMIDNQLEYIKGFGTFVDDNSKPNKGKFNDLLSRSELWINRYQEASSQAKMMACADQKLKWVINGKGNCKEHCSSCMKLNNKVKRASYWNKLGLHPQSSLLECGGWRCCCIFEVTNEPISPGRLSI